MVISTAHLGFASTVRAQPVAYTDEARLFVPSEVDLDGNGILDECEVANIPSVTGSGADRHGGRLACGRAAGDDDRSDGEEQQSEGEYLRGGRYGSKPESYDGLVEQYRELGRPAAG